ncbi:MAG: PAS domain S-box protein [Bacteroidales bacterium]|nr:PAS domain S-box protein [Bacteroidales bacterium]MBN2757737.1 PAS domain S-box protein [Bacteroidales bacterium]
MAVNLSQYKKKELVIKVFVESLNAIFNTHTFEWCEEKNDKNATVFDVCTRTKQYGYIKHNKNEKLIDQTYSLLQNAMQLLAILLDKLEQENLLNNQREHLKKFVNKQTFDLLEKQAELKTQNEEYEALNEELIQTNVELNQLNEELQNAKEKSEKNENKLKEAQSLAHIGNWELDLISYKLTWSDEIYRIFGCKPQEFGATYDAFLDFIHPDDREFVNNSYLNHINTKAPYDIIHRILLSNGEIKYVNERCKSDFNEQGKPLRSIGTVADITEQIKHEKELLRSEQELKKAQEITHIGSWYLDVATNEVIWSEELYKMYGFDPKLPVPPYIEHQKLFTPESWELLSNSLAKTTETGIPYELELKTVKKDGNNGWMWVRGETVLDTKGKTIGLWGTTQDITERKNIQQELIKAKEKAEENQQKLQIKNEEYETLNEELIQINNELTKAKEQIEENEAFLLNIFENIPNMIFIKDANDLKFVRFNKAGEQLLGYNREELIGKSDYDFFSKEQADFFTSKDKAVLESSDLVIIEEDNINTKFGSRVLNTKKIAIKDKNGINKYLLGISEDITEKKKIENELILSKEKAEVNEQRLSAFINSIPDIICYKDGNGKWLLANDADLELFCLTGVDYFGKTDIELSEYTNEIYKNAFINCMETDEEAWNNKTISNGIEIIPTVNGDKKVYDIYKVPVFDQNGERKGLAVIGRDISKLHETQENLIYAKEKAEENEKKFSAITNQAHEGIALSDLTGNYTFVNPAFCKMTGYSEKELLKLNIKDLKANDQAPVFEESKTTKARKQIQVKLKRKDESEFYTEMISRVITFDNQDFVLETVRDITEQKKAEEALKNSLQRLNEAQRQAHIGSWELDLINNKLVWTDEIYRMFEINPKKFGATYEAFLDVIHPDDRDTVNFAYTNSLKTKSSYVVEHRLLLPDGRIKYVHEQCETFYDGNKPIRSIGTVQDITNRKKSEEALKDSELHYHQIVDLSQNMIVIHQGGKIVFINDAGVRLLGASSPNQIIGKPVLNFVPQSHKQISKERIKLAQINGPKKSQVYEQKLIRIDGTLVDIELMGTSINYRGKEALQFVARDITDRKKAEEEIQKLNKELEQRVAKRTTQLESANKELEAFAYSVSHDLRSPLRSIDGFSQILLEEFQDKIDVLGKDYLHRIRIATQRMAQLIDDILSLSRVSRLGLNIQKLNLSETAQIIANDLLATQPERKVKFIIHDEIIVLADANLMYIVLENLIGNAWKFTSKHPTANIEFGVQLQNSKSVYFICDDGAGFDMNFAQKLFGVFQRLHTVKEFEGTGIGLATVQRIIHKHGGKIWAEGKIEKGATFYFTI